LKNLFYSIQSCLIPLNGVYAALDKKGFTNDLFDGFRKNNRTRAIDKGCEFTSQGTEGKSFKQAKAPKGVFSSGKSSNWIQVAEKYEIIGGFSIQDEMIKFS
jgi:hypothetical protein